MRDRVQSVGMIALVVVAAGTSVLAFLGLLEPWTLAVIVAVVGLAWANLAVYGAMKSGQPIGRVLLALAATLVSGALWVYLSLVWSERLGG